MTRVLLLSTYEMGRQPFGLASPAADVTASDVQLAPFSASASIKGEGRLTLRVPGRHNLQNALAVVAVGRELGLTFEQVAAGLHEFIFVLSPLKLVGATASPVRPLALAWPAA